MINRLKWQWLTGVLMLMICISASAKTPVIPEDGLYTVGVTSNAEMFRVVKCVLSVEKGEITAVLTLSGQGYGYLYPGTSLEADAASRDTWVPFQEDQEGKYTFAIPIPSLDTDMDVASYSKKYEKWYDRVLNFQSDTLRPYTALATPVPQTAFVAADGAYTINASSDSALFSIADCILAAENGKMTVVLRAKTTTYDYLYVGRAQDARKDEANRIPAVKNGDGTVTFTFDIPAIDIDIAVATFSQKKSMWYDRTLYFESASMAVLP